MADLVGNPEDRFSRVAAQLLCIWHVQVDALKLLSVKEFQLFKNLNLECLTGQRPLIVTLQMIDPKCLWPREFKA